MGTAQLVEVNKQTPLLLRRVEKIPASMSGSAGGHMTIVTTPGMRPEMNDQLDDATRYDRD